MLITSPILGFGWGYDPSNRMVKTIRYGILSRWDIPFVQFKINQQQVRLRI